MILNESLTHSPALPLVCVYSLTAVRLYARSGHIQKRTAQVGRRTSAQKSHFGGCASGISGILSFAHSRCKHL